jgi:hypothetical protein
LLLTPFALSEPLGGQVSAGAGSVTQSGATTTILQASPNLSLNWKRGCGVILGLISVD